jgi:dienelactone hydrolase
VLALHDHGGNKYFGWRKIAQISGDVHPIMREHRDEDYGGVSWANELAKRGYAVLVHDTFAFASRRVRVADVPEVLRGDLKEAQPESVDEIRAYNRFASDHEHIMAKSLFCAGTTWPGVFVAEDRRALDYLCSRPDVDPARVGCGGLSGGGLRTVYLGGTDDRIACACCVGMMTTWRDYLLHKVHTHTWMIYIPGLPLDLDYPEVLALRVPRPVLVQFDEEDPLFTLPEMRRADGMLTRIFAKAGAGDRYRGTFYPGPHKFDRAMQAEAFDWFDRWLKG